MRLKQSVLTLVSAGSFLLTSFYAVPTAAASQNPVGQQPMNHPGGPIQSSIQLTQDQIRQAHEAAFEAFQKKLKHFAKISASQADKAAQKEVPDAKIERTSLQTAGPNLVYVVLLSNSTQKDLVMVIVDAGNGQILQKRTLPPHHGQSAHQTQKHSPVNLSAASNS